MNYMIKNIFKSHLLFYVFFISIFLIKAPPFYYVPITNSLFSSHTLAKILIIFSLSLYLVLNISKVRLLINKNNHIILVLSLFFLTQSLSIITASDIIFFLKSYHNIIIAMFIFLLSYFMAFLNKSILSMIFNFILITGVFLVFLELIFFIFPYYLLPFFRLIIQKEVLDAYLTNIERGRYSLELNAEVFLPFFLLKILLQFRKNSQFIIASVIVILISFVSNFRTRVVMILFIIISFFLLTKSYLSVKQKIFIPLFIGLIILISLWTSNFIFRFNIVDRFLLSEDIEERAPLEYRISSAVKSVDMFLSSPLLGKGLGNFINYNNENRYYKYSTVIKSYQKAYMDLVRYSPHNIFLQIMSETGGLGLITFAILIIFFLIGDIKFIKKNKINIGLAFIISSWTSFIYMLFNPAYSISTIGWFWFMRGIISGYNGKGSKIMWPK